MTGEAQTSLKRLLLVDDEPRNLGVLEGLLAPLGHKIVLAGDGRSALAEFDARPPDLVLLDLVMPGFDGIDVLTHIRAHAGGDHVPVILVTAHSERDHRLRGLEAGADEFLEKPVDGSILLTRVRTLLQLKESRDGLRRANTELGTRNAALERLQREQRELMAFIVHDLKTPLSIVWSSVEFAQTSRNGDAVKDALEDAAEGTRRLRSMIDDLLMVSRLEESAFPLHTERVPLSELLGTVARDYLRRAQERKVDLHAAETKLAIKTDRTLLQRVIENILDNSLRYTPAHGQVDIAARAGREVEIVVSNTGPSIPEGDRLRIFEKFARLEQTGVARGNAGLGLYFCKRAVEAMGGQIDVVQTPEWPTSFVVRLPAA
ncbi:MAG TPA: hybrid sensor histidine kinase/response regulator [Polyangiaceae bacterium]|jgi:signal transduction histidine kinase